MKLRFIITLIALTLIPLKAGLAEDMGLVNSVSYSIMNSFITTLDDFIRYMFPTMMEDFKGLFITISTLFLVFYFFRMLNGQVHIDGLIKLFISISLINVFVFTSEHYYNYIYDTVKNVTLGFPAYIISLSSGGVGSTLEEMFLNLDQLSSNIHAVTAKMWASAPTPFAANFFVVLFKVLVLNTCYFILKMMFIWLFIAATYSVYIMLTVFPFGIALAPFEQMRGLFFNMLKGLSSYMLVPVFAAIIMGIALYMSTDVSEQASFFISNGTTIPLDDDGFRFFYSKAVMISLLSMLMLIKVPEFSNQIMAGSISSVSSLGRTIAGGYLATQLMRSTGRASAEGTRAVRSSYEKVKTSYNNLRGAS